MRVSVAMAVRNAQRYLPELLASLDRQSLTPYELVAYDDASSDGTPELLAAFASTAPFPVRVERHDERRGHVAGFLRAARRCRGDAIAFCDGDDVWLPDKLEVCARELEESGATLVLHTTRVVDATLRDLGVVWPSIGATRTAPPLALTGLDVDAPGMAMVVRRDLVDVGDGLRRPSSRYDPGREMLHDEWTFFLAGVLGPIRLLATPLVLYRQHEANDSGGWVRRRRERRLEPAVDDYRRAAAHTRECARLLADAAPASPGFAERLAAGARHYERSAASWERRLALYATSGRRRRVRLLWNLLMMHAYRGTRTGGFGQAALAKDLVGGILLRVRTPA